MEALDIVSAVKLLKIISIYFNSGGRKKKWTRPTQIKSLRGVTD